MKNEYEVRGEVTAIFLDRKDGTLLETLIDTDDLEKADKYPLKWYASFDKGTRTYYVLGHTINENGKKSNVSLHRWLMDVGKLKVDHFNHDTLDNRRSCNLREATHQENKQNRKGAQRNSKSGIRGVIWHKQNEKWEATICVSQKTIHLGTFVDIEDAENAVKAGRAKYMPYSQEALAN